MFGKEWAAAQQVRRMVTACKHARIEPHVAFTNSGTPGRVHAVMAGMPLAVVARNRGHVDTKMCERRYAHLAPTFVVDQVRKFAPTFGKIEATNVKAIR